MDFENYVLLKKHLNGFRNDHPLLVNFKYVPSSMRYIENLLKELEGTPNLEIKIAKLRRDPDNWESYIAELELARKLKALNPEFIKEQNGRNGKTPDLKIRLSTENDVFFEVKLFRDLDPIWEEVKREIEKIKSDLIVYVHLYPNIELYKNQAVKLKDYIKSKIEDGSTGFFIYVKDEIEVRIDKKEDIDQSKRTLFSFCRSKGKVNAEHIRRIIRDAFNRKVEQFKSRNPLYWVIDCNEKWEYDITDFKRAFYGDSICTDKTVLELSNEHFLDPKATPNQPDKTGLFFQENAEFISGVLVITERDVYLLNNPSAKQQLDNNSITELKNTFQRSIQQNS